MSTRRTATQGLILTILSTLAFVGSGCSDNVSDRDIEMIDLAAVRAAIADPGTTRLLDPRSPAEFAQGRIPTAVNIPLADISDRKDDIDPRLARFKGVIVYGNDPGSGVARATAKRLMRSGLKGVRMFAGGIAEWRTAGLKLEADAPKPSVSEAAPAPSGGSSGSGFGKPPTSTPADGVK